MATSKLAWIAGVAGILCAALAWGVSGRPAPAALPAPPFPVLGSEASCAAYAGLPPGWGSEPKAGMARLPGGEFTFGTRLGYPEERPAGSGRVKVQGFWIDRTEVTQAQFAAFVAATGYVTDAERQGGAVVFQEPSQAELHRRPYAWWRFVTGANWRHPEGLGSNNAGRENQPVTLVTQADALAYARWLGRDLPTEAEWEYAGKAGRDGTELEKAPRDAGGKPGGNYWQGNFPMMNTAEDGHAGLAPVGCYAPNGFGLYDMIGNAWEWTRDEFTGTHVLHANGDTAAVANAARSSRKSNTPMVIKGGSYLCSPDYCVRYRASSREAQEADLGAGHIGFRTVLRAD